MPNCRFGLIPNTKLLSALQPERIIDRAWKDNVGGQLVGLEQLRCLLQRERVRYGELSIGTPRA